MAAYPEVEAVLNRARAVMATKNIDLLWARSVANVAWLTQGVNVAVNTASDLGIASVVVTRNAAYILTNTIEAPRLKAEDKLEEKGFTVRVAPWWSDDPFSIIREILPYGRIGSDHPTTPEMVGMAGLLSQERSKLSPAEQDKARQLGRLCAAAMDAAIRQVTPGMTEDEIAALLDHETRARGVTPVVNLTAVDDRIFKVRHPISVGSKMDKYAMLVLCGRREGLIVSVTRLVHFGELSDELAKKMRACMRVDAVANLATVPGATLGEVFSAIQKAYADTGFADEWQLHHQGGSAGYAAREVVAGPGATQKVVAGQIYAWNPSITGTKCEDTILVTDKGPEVLTTIEGWPVETIEVDGKKIDRPLILVK